jgi:hypothetical protein
MTKEDLIKEFDRLIKAHYEEEIDSRDEWLREIISLKEDVVKKLIIHDVIDMLVCNYCLEKADKLPDGVGCENCIRDYK